MDFEKSVEIDVYISSCLKIDWFIKSHFWLKIGGNRREFGLKRDLMGLAFMMFLNNWKVVASSSNLYYVIIVNYSKYWYLTITQ